MDKEIRVSITPSTIITAICIIAGVYVLWILRGLALLVLTAVVLASAIEPGVNFFRKRRVPRVLAVLVMYAILFGSFFGLVYFFLPPILIDAQNFLSQVPQYLNTLNLPSSITGSLPLGNELTSNGQAEPIFQTLVEFRSAFSADTSQGAFRLISTVFGGVFSLILVVVLSFYFAIQETGVEDFLRLVTPQKHENYVLNLWSRAKVKIGQWMQGQLIMSVIISVTIYLLLLLFQVPDALLIAVFTAVAELIPIFGSILAAIPAVLIAYTAGGFIKALTVAIIFFVANQFEGHLIHPLVVRRVVGVPPLLVILALIAGGELAGFLGVLLAVPVAAVIREILADFDKQKRKVARERASA